jgi:hypothetical protein
MAAVASRKIIECTVAFHLHHNARLEVTRFVDLWHS